MTRRLICIETHARPAARVIEVEPGEALTVFVLPLTPDTPRGLRRTVVRREDELPPEGALLLLRARVDPSGLSVLEVGRAAVIELLRGDLRSQVVSGIRLPLHALTEVTLPDRSRILLGLHLEQEEARGAAVGVAGSGTRSSRVRFATENVWWLVVDAGNVMIGLGRKIRDTVVTRLERMGVDEGVISWAAPIVIAALGAGATYWQYQQAEAARADASAAQEALARAEAAQAAALATELSCLEQRQVLVAELGREQSRRNLAAEAALELALSDVVSVEVGGTRMGTQDVRALDALRRPNLIGAVVSRVGQAVGDVGPCLGQQGLLDDDLPTWLLSWHPDPTLTCPLSYRVEEGGVVRMGRWGLSDRVAREFGEAGRVATGTAPQVLEELLGDPRQEDRWAASTLIAAFRSIQRTLLETDVSPRPPALPSQGQLWSLALLDAYNRLPSPAGGALDEPADACIERLLRARLATSPPVGPGEPILPDLTSVAVGDVVVVAPPTPGCPWPRDAIRQGADAALHAVARVAEPPRDPPRP